MARYNRKGGPNDVELTDDDLSYAEASTDEAPLATTDEGAPQETGDHDEKREVPAPSAVPTQGGRVAFPQGITPHSEREASHNAILKAHREKENGRA